MIDVTHHQNDKYDFLLDKIHTILDAAAVNPALDLSVSFNEIVDFLFDNFTINKAATMLMTLDIERVDHDHLMVLNSTNLVYGIINGLVRFSRDHLETPFSSTDGFKKFADQLWNAATQ